MENKPIKKVKYCYACTHCREVYILETYKIPQYIDDAKCPICSNAVVFLCAADYWRQQTSEEKEKLLDKIQKEPNFDTINLFKIEKHLHFIKKFLIAYVVLSIVGTLIIFFSLNRLIF